MGGEMSFLENKPSQMELYPIITALFCGCLIISNILASKTFSLYDIILPCGIAIFLPGTDLATSNAFSIILGSTPRILIASLISYLVGSYVNAYFMKILKERYTEYLFARCSISTLFGEGLDAIIFITIAFAGLMPNEVLITMIICQGAFKIIYEIIVYPITRTVINWIKSLDDTPFEKIA